MALIGIARLAAQGELLEAKRSVQSFEIPTRSILNRTKPTLPLQWTINPYRGCEFGCKYCYARYTHEFMEMDPFEFEDKIYAKTAAADAWKAPIPSRATSRWCALRYRCPRCSAMSATCAGLRRAVPRSP